MVVEVERSDDDAVVGKIVGWNPSHMLSLFFQKPGLKPATNI